MKGLIDKSEEVKKLKESMEKVQQQLDQTQQDLAKVFSQLKASIKRAERAENRADSAEKQAETERKEREKAEKAAARLRDELDALKPKPVKPLDLGFDRLLTAAKAQRTHTLRVIAKKPPDTTYLTVQKTISNPANPSKPI